MKNQTNKYVDRGFVVTDKQSIPETRFPLFFLQDRYSLGRRTELPLYQFIVSSIWNLDASAYVVSEIRGDWKFFIDTFGMRATPSSRQICYKCAATLRNFGIFGLTAPWVTTRRSNREFLHDVLPELDDPMTCPMVWLPHFTVEMLKACFLHTAHLGVGLFSNGSGMKVLMKKGLCGEGDKEAQLRQLYVRFTNWRKARKIDVAFPRFRGYLLKDEPLQQVWYHTKGWHSRILTGFLADVFCEEVRSRPDDVELSATAMCIWYLAELYNAVERAGRYMTQEACMFAKYIYGICYNKCIYDIITVKIDMVNNNCEDRYGQ